MCDVFGCHAKHIHIAIFVVLQTKYPHFAHKYIHFCPHKTYTLPTKYIRIAIFMHLAAA